MTPPADGAEDPPEIDHFIEACVAEPGDLDALVRCFSAKTPPLADLFVALADALRLAAPPAAPVLPDFTMGPFLGAGGNGVVFEATNDKTGRRVAIKTCRSDATAAERETFLREQRTLARLELPGVVRLYQVFEHSGRPYIEMEFVTGTTLRQVRHLAQRHLDAGQPIPEFQKLVTEAALATDQRAGLTPRAYYRAAAGLIAGVAETVARVHAAAVLHRDIKPSNIMLDAAAAPCLIDFGLAGRADGDPASAGTPNFTAPEVLAGRPAAEAADVWGLGATLAELATLRRHPFGVTAPSLRVGTPNLPRALDAICRKAADPDPAQRYATAEDFAADLRRWLANRPIQAQPPRLWRNAHLWGRRNWPWATAAVTAAAAVSLLIVGAVWNAFAAAAARAERAEWLQLAAVARADEERDKVRLLRREAVLQDVHRILSEDAVNGWSDRAWAALVQANDTPGDDRVRNLAIGSMTELDADLATEWPFGSSAVAFGPAGQLVVGGLSDAAGRPVQPARVRGPGAAESARGGDGPVAVDSCGHAVHLIRETGGLVLWDATAGTAVWRAAGPAAGAEALSTDAMWAAAAGTDGRTRVWRTTSPDPWLTCAGAATAVAISPKGAVVAVATGGRVAVFDLATRECVAALPAGPVPVLSLAFGQNPRRDAAPLSQHLLAVGDGGGTTVIWDVCDRLPVSYCRGAPHQVLALAFSPDGTLLATGGREEVRLWDVADGRPRLRLRPTAGTDFVSSLAFSPAGDRLAVASRGSALTRPSTTVWVLTASRGLRRLRGLTGRIEAVAVSPDGKSVAAIAHQWELGVWDAHTGHLKFLRPVPPGEYADNTGLAFAADGRTLAYGSGGTTRGTALLLDAGTGAEVRRWDLPPGLQHHFGFDGDRLWHFQVETKDGLALPTSAAPAAEHPRVGRLRDLMAGPRPRVAAEVRDFPTRIHFAVMSPDGKYTLVEGRGPARGVAVLDHAAGKTAVVFPAANDNNTSTVGIDATGRWAWFGAADLTGTAWLALPPGPVTREQGVPPVAAHMAAGYSVRATHAGEFGCFLFHAPGDRPVANVMPGRVPSCAAFDPAGRMLVLGSDNGRVTICDLKELRDRLNALGLGWPSR